MPKLLSVNQCKVSSTQEGNSASFHKRNMFDGNSDSCWNSKQGDHTEDCYLSCTFIIFITCLMLFIQYILYIFYFLSFYIINRFSAVDKSFL